MSSILNNAAAAAVSKGVPSSFYAKEGKSNPVFQALDQELKLFTGYMKKRSSEDYIKPEGEPHSRPADALFNLWNKYEPRLPPQYYQSRLLEIGDFLVSIKEYKIALWQCYERYLQTFGDINVEEISDVDTFRTTFFPDGFSAENAGLTFRALMGKSISMYQVVRMSDPKLQNKQSIERCVQILSFLRLVTQVVLPKESLCWLVYNGTVHIYSMSRHLMSLGHSSRVLEYLLWASMCMETSVPLLAVKYLAWRATLYTAVCQCYYDCKAGDQAEKFARRGLAKVSELSQLELLSSNKDTPANEIAFRTATVRMAVMVFKRSVFETRRKPKGILRPKTRANLKDSVNLPWPRTSTEKMLADMFDGSSAQFLAIVESLSNSNRRFLQPSPPAPDNEPEILDVFCELMMAAQEILAGGGGNRTQGSKAQLTMGAAPLTAVTFKTRSLIALATKGEDVIPLDSVIRLVKMAYNYEHWDVFESLLEPVLLQIKESGEERYKWDEKALELLQAVGKMSMTKRMKKQSTNVEEDDNTEKATQAASTIPSTSVKSMSGDELIHVADVLMSIITGPYRPANIDIDMVVDATMFLWNKCKLVFQRYQTGSVDNPRFLQKMENPNKESDSDSNSEDDQEEETEELFNLEFTGKKTTFAWWMYLLDTVHQALGWCGISSVDPALTAEVVLRLAMVYESSAHLDTLDGKAFDNFGTNDLLTPHSVGPTPRYYDSKSALKESKTTLTDYAATPAESNQVPGRTSQLSLGAQASAKSQLIQAREILELGLKNVNFARQAVALNDGKNIADVTWVKNLGSDFDSVSGEFNPEIFGSDLGRDMTEGMMGEDSQLNPDLLIPDSMKGSATAVWNMVKDLHLELMVMYHRVCLKLAALDSGNRVDKFGNAKGQGSKNMSTKGNLAENYIENFEELCNHCNKNCISKALLYTQRAVMLGTDQTPSQEQQKLLEDAMNFLERVQTEEKKIYQDNSCTQDDINIPESKVPPPPVLLCRTDSTMVFRPAPFCPSSGQKVAWYRIFARGASGANVKARLSDYHFPGTGEEVPSFHCELKISSLEPNERYVFAVAAYTADGKLIGDGIGQTTRPILASHPLPVLMSWALISQMAYQVGYYRVARKACSVLWDHFVVEPQLPSSSTYTTEAKKDFKLTLLSIDIAVREGELFCDIVCDKGALYDRQMSRLHQCERMLVAVELAGWLNEANLALQAVVQIYGLLAPLLYFKIPSLPVIQILQRCHAVLLEIPIGLIQKRPGSIADSLNHMIACITYHLAKVLRTWGQKSLANNIIEAGRRLLSTESDAKTAETEAAELADGGSADSLAQGKGGKKKGPLPIVKKMTSKDDLDGPVNEELKALEAHMLSVTKAATAEHELSGSEDPSILHAYIAYLPSFIAFKEVVKFKRRARYLEFLVHVAQKGLTEGLADQVVNWCEDGAQWLGKRNEGIIGSKAFLNKQPGAVIVTGDDPKKFAAAMVEYSKEKDATPRQGKQGGKDVHKTASKNSIKKKSKYKPVAVTESMSEMARQQQEEDELRALDLFSMYFVDLYRMKNRRSRLRKITVDEVPWRSQLNIIHGLSHFSTFLQKLEKREKMFGSTGTAMNRTSFLDQEFFTLETAGVMIVGWEGGPSRQHQETMPHSPHGYSEFESVKTAMQSQNTADRPRTTGIEIAAAAATGAPPPPMYPIPQEIEDTPRTYRSDKTRSSGSTNRDSKIQEDSSPLTTAATIEALQKTFTYFKRAVVLAHRGQHWTLLQNAGRALWNCAHTALLRAFTADQSGGDPGLLTIDMLRSLVWHPFYMATDCLLDMMSVLQDLLEKQATRAKSRGKTQGGVFNSWMGDVRQEKGGASLRFDPLLDDINLTDVRWLRRLVERTLEMLYFEQKWEKLVDIALRFSALTNYRYAEEVLPMMIQAQRFLQKRIEMAGGPFPHFEAQLGGVMTAKEYLKAQIKVVIDKDNLGVIHPGAQIDPIGHDTYSAEDAFKLSSVPLNVTFSLKTLRETLDQSHYTARALRHSRKLLCLYLAGQQNASEISHGREVTHVDFRLATGQPQPVMPPNKMKSDFSSVDEVQLTPIPRSQLGTVISSYEKTIDILFAKNHKGLAAQGMHELGNILFHARNPRAAYKWWSQSLDIVLNMDDALHTWRSNIGQVKDISSHLLARCGLWGCLMAGTLASNIAQYIVSCDIGLKMECCFLSGFLFKALFRSSLPHPTADRDYALYDVGEGCEVTNLVPGIDFMSDRFRCDGRQMVAALRWVTEELSRGQHNLFVLPLLSLYQYFTTFVCRDVQRAVDGRILKIRILTDLSLYTEALIVLQRLLNGERLPHTGDSNFRQMEGRSSSMKFNTAKAITDPQNLKDKNRPSTQKESDGSEKRFDMRKGIWNKNNFLVLENLIDKRLSSSLGTLFGPHMTCHLTLVQAHLFISLANTIPVLPKIEEHLTQDPGTASQHPPNISTISRGGLGSKAPKLSTIPSSGSKKDDSSAPKPKSSHVESEDGPPPARFSDGSRSLSLEDIKGILLSMSDQMVTTIADVITENAAHEKHGVEGMSAAELELVVLCRLEQVRIARQKHHGPMAARTVLGALRMLHNAQILKQKKPHPPPPREDVTLYERPSSMKGANVPTGKKQVDVRLTEPENAQHQYQDFQARSRLDARLWLQCRLELVHSLMLEIRGMGEIRGGENKVVSDLADCRQYCAEGLGEAEVCGDTEMQAQFYLQGAQLNIIEGKSLEHTISLLEDAMQLLRQMPCRSVPGEQLLATCIIFKADLEASAAKVTVKTEELTQHTYQAYLESQAIILNQMELLGEKIEHYYSEGSLDHLSCPVSPMLNIYLPHVQKLTQIKLRLGHSMARNTAKMIRNGNPSSDPLLMWVDCLGVLTTALEISQVSAAREASIEAEILLTMGKVQKMLVYLGKYQARAAANTLLEAIKISYINDHDLGLMRQAYLEIALIYLYSAGFVTIKDGSFLESVAGDSGDEVSVSSSRTERRYRRSKSNLKREKTKEKEETDQEKERRAAWLAVRCATAVANAQRARSLLIGDTSVMSQKVGDKSTNEVPDFVSLDLLSGYVLGDKKKVYKNEIEEELAPLIEAQEVKVVETYDDQVNKARVAANDLSWIHLLGYQSILQRLVSTSTISVSSQLTERREVEGEEEGDGSNNDLDLGFISHAQFDTGMNYDVVRYMLHSGPWSVRLTQMHTFLSTNLRIYAADCCAPYPPSGLHMPGQSQYPTELNITIKSYASNLSLNSEVEGESISDDLPTPPRAPLPPGSQLDTYKPLDKVSTSNNADSEISIQWYQPGLEEADPSRPDASAANKRIILLYAISKKGAQPTPSLLPGFMWVSQHKVNDLHDRLALLTQRAEISLVEKVKKEPTTPSPTPSKSKKTQRIKALSPKIQRDEQLENLLRQCLDDSTALTGSILEQGSASSTDIPFDVSKVNIKNLESVFDPSLGLTLKGTDLMPWLLKLFP